MCTQLKSHMEVPVTLVLGVLNLLHNVVFVGGHGGVSDKFYWRNIIADIANYDKLWESCTLCHCAPHYKAMAK